MSICLLGTVLSFDETIQLGVMKMVFSREFLERFPQFRGYRVHVPGIEKLIELRIAHPELSKSELARRTGISRVTVVKYLRILEEPHRE